jgi:hypothetical protein
MTQTPQQNAPSGHLSPIQPDVLDAKLLTSVGGMLVLLLVLIVVLLSAWYHAESNRQRQQVQAQPSQALRDMRIQQESQLQYRWVDRAHRIAGIPIDVAMQRVQIELQSPASTEASSQAVPP